MKKCILLFMFIIFYTDAYNQNIKGTVRDRETNSIICCASIYFNGTFVGTNSDQDGNFELDISKNTAMPLTISATGYYSASILDYSVHKPLVIYLSPKVYGINEVVVEAKSLVRKRRRNLAIFRKEFLGTTANARQCEILNEEDITFNYYSDRDTLKVFAEYPLLIENRSLGYSITYFLDKFEYYKTNSRIFFQGNIFFNDDINDTDASGQLYEERRRKAYYGSRMHFIRELWSGNLNSAGFEIRNSLNQIVECDSIIYHSDKRKFLKNIGKLKIFFYDNLSSIIFLQEHIYIDRTGYFDPAGIVWDGDMAQYRIADWLPYEYLLENN